MKNNNNNNINNANIVTMRSGIGPTNISGLNSCKLRQEVKSLVC